jgi:hypothetical protein
MVNEKMTAINDKIRSLLGITGKMGLDAMATNLETEQTNVENAFTAVGSMGGTVPDSKVSGNLVSAINSIPKGASIQTKTGTFSMAGNVTCGFQPDFIYISLNETDDGYKYATGLDFVAGNTTKFQVPLWGTGDCLAYDFKITRTTTGFNVGKIERYYYNLDTDTPSKTFNFKAIKYT